MVLADRWSRKLHLPLLQFAFLHRYGCFEATSLFHALLRHSSATASNLSLTFVDISKPFDSVSLLPRISTFYCMPWPKFDGSKSEEEGFREERLVDFLVPHGGLPTTSEQTAPGDNQTAKSSVAQLGESVRHPPLFNLNSLRLPCAIYPITLDVRDFLTECLKDVCGRPARSLFCIKPHSTFMRVAVANVSAPFSAAGDLSMETSSTALEFNESSESLIPQAGWQTSSKTPRKKHPYTTCGKNFTSLSHASTQDISTSFMCEIRSRVFRQHASLGQHKRYGHASEGRERTTPQSAKGGNLIRDRSVSKRHMIRHSAEESCLRPTCSQMFPNRGALHKHKLLEHDKVPVDKVAKHECAVCKRWFEDIYRLKRHSVVHTKQRRFVCVLCAKAYSHPEALGWHHRTNHRH
ncbi:hypothetical protein CSKR_114467 [Clonorchis sinensis]|uniref:C2H2-type domain-containing protein n=1 Tax=Clonorchis sinensis TaxID=79923 RepID=A0A419QA36_CLOSI|nr:hypothetical protein CSKR_114467 [Clonorchis sinensis]